MSKSILCAVDINRPEEEKEVLITAAKLAKMDGAQLDVITVVPDYGNSVVGAYFQDHEVEGAKAKAGELLKDLTTDALGDQQNADIRHVVAMGTVYEEVLRAAKLGSSDLIVIGAHSPDFKDYLLGPNAARVVRHSNCSVLVLRD